MKTYIPPEEYGDIDFMQLELVKTDKQPRKEYTQVVRTKNNFDLKLVPYTEEQYQKRKKWVEGIVANLGIDVENVKKQLNSQKSEKELQIEEFKKKTKKMAEEKLKDSKPLIKITGNEFEGKTIEEKREKAKQYYKDNFENESFTNTKWNRIIKILSADKTFSQTASEDKINTFKYLDKMLENAEYITSGEDTKHRPNVKGWHYLATKITTNKNGQDIDEIVIFSVREDNNGNIYYNHTINEKEVDIVSSQDSCSCTPTSTSNNNITYNNENVKCYFVGADEE